MLLYHGSYVEISQPDLSFARERTDFGKGFYLTPLKEQALRWAERFQKGRGSAILSSYEFLPEQTTVLPPSIKILEFAEHNLEWLNFITACRLGQSVDTSYDLVIGGVANDKVFDTLQLYFDNLISAEDALGRLKYSKPSIQYCFKTQTLIDEYLQFAGSETL